MTLCEDLNLIWTQEFTSLGIDYNIKQLNRITDLNLEGKILDMGKLISIWKIRNLTLVGKITIIKTLLISKITHILLSLPKPSEEYFDRIEKTFLNFLWQNKPPIISIKASWLKRLYKSNEGWASTPLSYDLGKLYVYGDIFIQRKMTIQNTFWRDVVYSVHFILTNSTVKCLEHILSKPLWLNSNIMGEKMHSWEAKGLHTIGDMLDEDGHIFSLDYLKNILNIKCDFLFYNRLKKRIQNNIGTNHIRADDNLRPRLPYILYNIEIGSKGKMV